MHVSHRPRSISCVVVTRVIQSSNSQKTAFTLDEEICIIANNKLGQIWRRVHATNGLEGNHLFCQNYQMHLNKEHLQLQNPIKSEEQSSRVLNPNFI